MVNETEPCKKGGIMLLKEFHFPKDLLEVKNVDSWCPRFEVDLASEQNDISQSPGEGKDNGTLWCKLPWKQVNPRYRFKIKLQETLGGELVPVRQMSETGSYLGASPFGIQSLPTYVVKQSN